MPNRAANVPMMFTDPPFLRWVLGGPNRHDPDHGDVIYGPAFGHLNALEGGRRFGYEYRPTGASEHHRSWMDPTL